LQSRPGFAPVRVSKRLPAESAAIRETIFYQRKRKRRKPIFLDGMSVSQPTTETGISKSTIYRWIKEAQTEKDDGDDCTAANYYMLKQKYEKSKSIVVILQKVDCKPTDPLSVKSPEMETLYGQYSVHTLCDALCVPRGTFYNHIYHRKSSGKWYEIRREEFRERIRQIYDESNQVLEPKKICAVHFTCSPPYRQVYREIVNPCSRTHWVRIAGVFHLKAVILYCVTQPSAGDTLSRIPCTRSKTA
jgi:transposase